MSDGGGDSGGGGKGGGSGKAGDSGGSDFSNGGGDSFDYGGNGGASNFYAGTDYNVGGVDYAAGTGPLFNYTSPGSNVSGLPPEISSGASSPGGFDWFTPGIDNFTNPDGSGFNLSGPGIVGGDSGLPGMGGGSNTFAAGGVDSFGAPVGAFNPEATAGGVSSAATPAAGSATAFAAPAGVSGVPQLDALVANPNTADANASMPPTSPGQDIWSSLLPAEQAATQGSFATDKPIVEPGTTPGLPASTNAGVNAKSSTADKGVNAFEMLGIKPTVGTAAALAGLANSFFTGNKQSGNVEALKAAAGSNAALVKDSTDAGRALQQYLQSGTLPDAYEAQVANAAQAMKQKIISNHASRGMNTDPTQNSVLAQELSQIDQQIPQLRMQLAKSLYDAGTAMVDTGLKASGISSGIYQQLAKLEDERNARKSAAIGNFAAALNGGVKGGNGITLKVA